MTSGTVEAEFPVVYVVSPVAVAAAASKFAQCRQRLTMAIVALSRDMGTIQREVRLSVVVELPFNPVHRVMTGGTVFVVTTLMRIFFEMAIHACRRGIAKYVGLVAGITFLVGVSAQQRKASQVVIEEYIVLPGILVVAILALGALFAFVRVILEMAFGAF